MANVDMTVGAFLLILGASARLTRLVTDDKITEPVRNRFDPTGAIGYLLLCPWCIGLWISAATVAGWAYAPRAITIPVCVALTVNLLWGLTQDIIDRVTTVTPEPEPDPGHGSVVDDRRPNPDWER